MVKVAMKFRKLMSKREEEKRRRKRRWKELETL